jgi:hypothetical protein
MKLKLFIIATILLAILPAFASASCDWTEYGNTYSPLWNEQLSPSTCWGKLPATPINKSISLGMTAGNSMIVSSFGTNAYIVFNNGNYLQLYDKDLVLRQEANVGYTALASLVNLDFFGDGQTDDFANLYKYNNSLYFLRVYTYNDTANTLVPSYEYNVSDVAVPTLAGLRHTGQNIYFVNSTDLIKINSTDMTALALPSIAPYSEPVSFYTDYNSDGVRDFMTFSSNNLTIFDENGVLILQKTYSTTLRSARMFKPTASNLWKVATLEETGSGGATPTLTLTTYYLDGSSYWSKNIKVGSTSSQHYYGDIAVSDDYDGDNYPDLYVFGYLSYPLNTDIKYFRIYKGSDGTELFTKNISLTGASAYTKAKLTIADMNHDGKADFISNLNTLLEVYNPYSDTSLLNDSIAPSGYCIPSDLNFDGTQDIICSNSTKTKVYFSNYTNENPTINSVTYDPSTSVSISEPVNAIVSAYDVESDTKIYGVKCSDSDSFVGDSYTPTQTCIYTIAGVYNLSVGVRDIYHSNYNLYSHSIYVSSTGTICGDGLCNGGETYLTCPADCEEGGYIGGENGTITIPVDIVNLNDTNTGLLPEIYYGILGFLSNTLSPAITLIFAIFFVLIILALGTIIKRVAEKIGK